MSSNITLTTATGVPGSGRLDDTLSRDEKTNRDRRGPDRVIQTEALPTNTTSPTTAAITRKRPKQVPKPRPEWGARPPRALPTAPSPLAWRDAGKILDRPRRRRAMFGTRVGG